jgi:hypothetical protein
LDRTKQRSQRSNKQVLTGCGHDACHHEARDWCAAEEEGEDGRVVSWQAAIFVPHGQYGPA